MSDADEKLSGKLGIDTTDFKTGIAAANRELRVLESGFRAGAAALGDWTASATGLEQRAQSLTSQIEIQKLKVAALAAEHQRLAAENGANSRAAQDAEIKLNKETTTLGKMTNELDTTEASLQEMKSGLGEAGNEVQDLGEKSENATGKMDGLKAVMGGIGAAAKAMMTAVLAVGAAVVSAATALVGMALNTAKMGDELTDLSNQTGISTTRLQELGYAGKIIGTDLDVITGANARLIRSMASAADQTVQYSDDLKNGDATLGDTAKTFADLGVSITDSNGNLRDNQAVFADVIDALGKVENPAERDAIAMSLFGKSAQELNPLIKAGSAELAKYSAEAHTVGAVMSEENVAAAAAFQDQLDSLLMGLKGVGGSLGAVFLPAFSGVLGQAQGYLQELVGIVSGSGGDFGKMAEGLSGLFTKIAQDLAAQAPEMLQAGLAIVQSVLTAITGALPSMLTAGVEILKSLIDFIVQNLPMLMKSGVEILLMLVNAIIENLPALIDAALQAVITLANGLTDALPTLIPAVVQAILTIVETLLENMPMLITAALALIMGLAIGIIAALPVLIPEIPKIVKLILDIIIQNLPLIVKAAAELIMALIAGIIQNLPLLIRSAMQLIKAIYDAIGPKAQWNLMVSITKGLIDGLIQGWNDNWNQLVDQITTNFMALLDYIKGLLGIHSPSSLFAEMGRYSVMGFEQGFLKEMGGMQMRLGMAMTGMSLQLAGAGINGNTSNVSNEAFSFYGPVSISGGQGMRVSHAVKGRRF